MKIVVLAAGLGLTLAASAAVADGRYTLSPSGDGFLKLDTQTGAVSYCLRREAGFSCSLVPDDRDALQAEIDRLAGEVKTLREGGAAAADPGPAGPSDKDLDRAFRFMDRFLRHFRDSERHQGSGDGSRL